MKQCILHLGLPKTGTTSIQQSLFLNRDVLAAHRIFYPNFTIEGRSASRFACHIFQAITRNYEEIPPFWKLGFSRVDLRNMGLAQLDRAFDQFSRSSCSTFLISSELLDGRYFSTFCEILRSESMRLRGVLYVRAPDTRYRSKFQQALRAGRFLRIAVGIRKSLTEFQRCFAEPLTVRRYVDRSEELGWNAVDDFWTHVLELKPPQQSSITSNDSDPAEVSVVFAEMSNVIVNMDKDERLIFMGWCRNHIRNMQNSGLRFTRFDFGEPLRERILAACEADSRWLRETYDISWQEPRGEPSLDESTEIIGSTEQLRREINFSRETCTCILENLLRHAEAATDPGIDKAAARSSLLSALKSFS